MGTPTATRRISVVQIPDVGPSQLQGTGNATLNWTGNGNDGPVSRVQIVNMTGDELTFVPTDATTPGGTSFGIANNNSEEHQAPRITGIVITAPGAGKWYVRAFL